jgi:polyhydroxyalkanoate synthesis regulator phasin
MAQQRSSGPKRGRRSAKAAPPTSVAELRDALGKLVDPFVVLTRERIEEALNDAVSRGRVTADDAQELVATLLERGRRETNDVLGNLEQLLTTKADKARRAAGISPKGARKPPRPAAAKPASFPISGYDDLNAKQVQAKLERLSPAQLRQVRDRERRHANRKTILTAIDRRLK